MNPGGWTPERVAKLNKLWKEGLSASEIAKLMNCGFSRNAIIGKLDRLGLMGSREKASPPAKAARAVGPGKTSANPFGRSTVADTKARIERQAKVAEALKTGAAIPPFVRTKNVPVAIALAPRHWITRRHGECAWPVSGAGYETMSCCNRRAPEGPYCAEHKAIGTTGEKASVKSLMRGARRWAA